MLCDIQSQCLMLPHLLEHAHKVHLMYMSIPRSRLWLPRRTSPRNPKESAGFSFKSLIDCSTQSGRCFGSSIDRTVQDSVRCCRCGEACSSPVPQSKRRVQNFPLLEVRACPKALHRPPLVQCHLTQLMDRTTATCLRSRLRFLI